MSRGCNRGRPRGADETIDQIRTAPRGALFVLPHHALRADAIDMARKLDRMDLQLIDPRDLVWQRGRRLSAVVVDHGADLTDEQADLVAVLRASIREEAPHDR